MLTIERLFTMTNIKSLNIGAITGGKGLFSSEDALGVVAVVQLSHPLGVKILEAKISGSEYAMRILGKAVTRFFVGKGYEQSIAAAMGFMVVREVCQVPICSSCNGVGERYSKKFNQLFECQVCHGTGKILLTKNHLANQLSVLCNKTISNHVFNTVYYDDYMQAVDLMYGDEQRAATLARRTLDQTALEIDLGIA
ncbi:hypothetical protein [Shewanella sp. T24-MNA-CIBAN-0130]|uniref:hypothetical protein n=1 Tax=Shewanella sp. T24-MNA-CIBAN-0130 TaxID=3140470 RepID=UPI003317204E